MDVTDHLLFYDLFRIKKLFFIFIILVLIILLLLLFLSNILILTTLFEQLLQIIVNILLKSIDLFFLYIQFPFHLFIFSLDFEQIIPNISFIDPVVHLQLFMDFLFDLLISYLLVQNIFKLKAGHLVIIDHCS